MEGSWNPQESGIFEVDNEHVVAEAIKAVMFQYDRFDYEFYRLIHVTQKTLGSYYYEVVTEYINNDQ